VSISNRLSPISEPLVRVKNLNGGEAAVKMMQPRRSYRRNLLLDLPIAGRLALGFTLAALIATLASSVIGFQRSASLTTQSNFYQTLLQTNTLLTTGSTFLQLMNSETHTTLLDASAVQPSQETLAQDQLALQGLVSRYDNTLSNYTSNQLLSQHQDEVDLLNEGGHANQVTQQKTLVGSTLRTWTLYRTTQLRIMQDITLGNGADAQRLERTQGEPTNADAQSALRSLIQFDARLVTSIQDASNIEQQNQIVTTVISVIVACLLIGIVGWLISNTLVRRLRGLRRVSRMVEKGQLGSRVTVIGRDEIADVSESINSMLDTIVGLLEETRRQRDALTNAAHHLFSYMQVVSAGEFRASTSGSEDPIGMLTDAFNFTVGRFRRFVSRTQASIEQLEVVSRQEIERSEAFMRTLRSQTLPASTNPALKTTTNPSLKAVTTDRLTPTSAVAKRNALVVSQVNNTHEHLVHIARDVIKTHTITVLELSDQTMLAMSRLRQRIAPTLTALSNQGKNARQQLEELQAVESLLEALGAEIRSMQAETIRGITEADKLVVQSLNTLNTPVKEPSQPLPALPSPSLPAVQNSSEIARLGLNFVQEVINLARQNTAIAQEMREITTTFKVEAGEKPARDTGGVRTGTRSRPLAADVPRQRPVIRA
jgi:methyl-accepting chemotaxis protein